MRCRYLQGTRTSKDISRVTILDSNLATQWGKICKLCKNRGHQKKKKKKNHGNRSVFSSGELILTNGFYTGHAVIVAPCLVGFFCSYNTRTWAPACLRELMSSVTSENVLETWVFSRDPELQQSRSLSVGHSWSSLMWAFPSEHFLVKPHSCLMWPGSFFCFVFLQLGKYLLVCVCFRFSVEEEEPLIPEGVGGGGSGPPWRPHTHTRSPVCRCDGGHRWTWATERPTASSLPRDTGDRPAARGGEARACPYRGCQGDRWALCDVHVTGATGIWWAGCAVVFSPDWKQNFQNQDTKNKVCECVFTIKTM